MTIDEQLRDALAREIPPRPVDAPTVTERIMSRWRGGHGPGDGPHDPGRGGQPRTPKGGGGPSGLSAALPATIAGVAGVLIGGGIALAHGGPAEGTALAHVPVYACPGAGEVGSLDQGDRVYIVGRADGAYAVRNVRGDGGTVFVASRYVTADADASNLPELGCATSGDVTVATPSPSPTPAPSSTPTHTTTPPKPKPPTKPAGDTAKPVISNAAVTPGTVYDPGFCTPPKQATLTAHVTDNKGVASVKASWTLKGTPVTKTMSPAGGGVYTATFGPIAANTLGGHETVSVAVTITAKDAAGNTTTTTVHVTVTSDGGGCLY